MTRILLKLLVLLAPVVVAAQGNGPATVLVTPLPTAQTSARMSADSVRPYLVFAPTGESWFVAASRGKRMLLDIGRVDLEVRRDSVLAQAFREAVVAASPVPVGTRFTVRGPWGTESVTASAVDTWNGRIVLVLSGSAAMDSAAQDRGPVVASGFRERAASVRVARTAVAPGAPLAARPAPDSALCPRAPLSAALTARMKVLRDSIERTLRAAAPPPYERLAKHITVSSSQVVGCFGPARVVLAVSLRAGATEWTREKMILVDTLGRAQSVAVEDLRFKVHDLLHAVDADGDGIDDVAAIARTHRAGGTTLLRFDARRRTFVRLAAGFVWEDP